MSYQHNKSQSPANDLSTAPQRILPKSMKKTGPLIS